MQSIKSRAGHVMKSVAQSRQGAPLQPQQEHQLPNPHDHLRRRHRSRLWAADLQNLTSAAGGGGLDYLWTNFPSNRDALYVSQSVSHLVSVTPIAF